MAKRIGLYPGTFDPVTLGHLDIVKRAIKLVDHLVIGVGTGTGKNPLFSYEERVQMWRNEAAQLTKDGGSIDVQPFGNVLQVDFARSVGATMVVRGLRAMSDFEYEFQIVGMNQRLAPDIETVFLMADPEISVDRVEAREGGRHAGRGRLAIREPPCRRHACQTLCRKKEMIWLPILKTPLSWS